MWHLSKHVHTNPGQQFILLESTYMVQSNFYADNFVWNSGQARKSAAPSGLCDLPSDFLDFFFLFGQAKRNSKEIQPDFIV